MRTREMKKLFKDVGSNQTAFLRSLLVNGHKVDDRAVKVAGISNVRARICEIKRNLFYKTVRNIGNGVYVM